VDTRAGVRGASKALAANLIERPAFALLNAFNIFAATIITAAAPSIRPCGGILGKPIKLLDCRLRDQAAARAMRRY
jgi:hypothetical protein